MTTFCTDGTKCQNLPFLGMGEPFFGSSPVPDFGSCDFKLFWAVEAWAKAEKAHKEARH